jgi:hypothetical protein
LGLIFVYSLPARRIPNLTISNKTSQRRAGVPEPGDWRAKDAKKIKKKIGNLARLMGVSPVTTKGYFQECK